MDEKDKAAEVLSVIIAALASLDAESRKRVLDSVIGFYGVERPSISTFAMPTTAVPRHSEGSSLGFSKDFAPTPKDFLYEKQPRSDVERIACLAFYLTHYRDTPHFKTLELSKLNTEAAQPKFSNAAYASNNAAKLGYLVPATKGNRQLSAAGEEFVRALPDRDAAKRAMERARPRRLGRRNKKTLNEPNVD